MATPQRDETIDQMFQDAIKSYPESAKSHFEVVDPGVWRFDVSGRLFELGTHRGCPHAIPDIDHSGAHGIVMTDETT